MLFELIDFLDWRWLVAFHLIVVGIVVVPFLVAAVTRRTGPRRKD